MHKDQGGKCIELQGIKCYLPPEPELVEIAGFHLPREQQKWKPTPLPTFKARDIPIFSGTPYSPEEELSWEQCRREEIVKQTGHDPWHIDKNGNPRPVSGVEIELNYKIPQLRKFRKQELNRIRNGYWFMLDGEPTYLPGIAYMYFNWWRMDVGLPEYRDYIRLFSYVVMVAWGSDNIIGVLLASMRGIGKSYFAACVLYTITVFIRNSFSGMQSKSDNDSENLFIKKLGEPVAALPDFLVPVNSFGWPSVPKTRMEFMPPMRRHPNTQWDMFLRKSAIRSIIDYRNAKDSAYDSETTTVLLQDEIGKIDKKTGSVNRRFEITRFCVWRGNVKRGILFGFTTVGNMERAGGKEFKQLFKDSDQNNPEKINEIGWTLTGCVKYFISALDSTFTDEFGKPDHKKSKRFHDAQRKQIYDDCIKAGDMGKYIAYCQNNPYTEEEAFMFSGKDCVFNAQILQDVQIKLTSVPPDHFVVRGDYVWEEVDKKAKFVENKVNGKWIALKYPDGKIFGPDGGIWKPNNVRIERYNGTSTFFPIHDTRFCTAGFDPFSHRDVVEVNKASKGSITFRSRANFHWPEEFCEVPFAHYLARPLDPETSFEDLIIACFYFGTPVLVENNKNAFENYFIKRGYEAFIMRRPQSTFTRRDDRQNTLGIPSSKPIIEQYTNLAGTDIVKNGSKFRILPIIDDALEFDPTDTRRFDSFVSYGLSLIAAEKPAASESKMIDITNILPSYN
jgi:hypothetical protein